MPYDFKLNLHDQGELKRTRISDLKGEDLQSELKHWADSLSVMVNGEGGYFNQRGAVVLVNAPWGAGKTVATHALVNEVNERPGTFLHTIHWSFLPFGNASESIATFLTHVATEIHDKGVVNLKKEINSIIPEVTPSEYDVTFNGGPFSITRHINIHRASRNLQKQEAEIRLRKLFDKPHQHEAIALVIDDLDRLKSDEIVALFRMIEKLRDLPRFLIFVPIYKKIAIKAYTKELNISDLDAVTFLRKMTDAEVDIASRYQVLETIFKESFEGAQGIFSRLKDTHGLTVGEFCWYALVHNIVIQEALSRVGKYPADQQAAIFLRVFEQSPYLSGLKQRFIQSTSSDAGEVYPVKLDETVNGTVNSFFVAIRHINEDIIRVARLESSLENLSGLTNLGGAFRHIYTNSEVIAGIKSSARQRIPFSEEQAKNYVWFFDKMIKELVQGLTEEPFVTEKYEIRDIKILSQRIQGDSKFRASSESEKVHEELYNIVQKHCQSYFSNIQ